MKGSILKRGKDSWRLKFDLGRDFQTGKRKLAYRTIRGTKRQAEAELRRHMTAADEGIYVDPSKMNVQQWLEVWLADYIAPPVVREKTHERYCQLLRIHVNPHLGSLPIQKLAPLHIQALYQKLRTEGLKLKSPDDTPRGLAETTICHVHRALSHALTDAVRGRVIHRNVCKDVRAPKQKKTLSSGEGDPRLRSPKEKLHALDRNQLDQFLNKIRESDIFVLIVLAFATGARRSELLALRWTDIDFNQGSVRIERALEITKRHGVRVVDTKNASSRRTVSIDKMTLRMLKTSKTKQLEKSLELGMKLPDDALLFPTSCSKPYDPLIPYNISRRFSGLAEKAGFSGLKFHSCRHTHASILLSENVPVNAVSARLGHASPVVTMTVYSHLLKRAEDQASLVAASLVQGAFSGE